MGGGGLISSFFVLVAHFLLPLCCGDFGKRRAITSLSLRRFLLDNTAFLPAHQKSAFFVSLS